MDTLGKIQNRTNRVTQTRQGITNFSSTAADLDKIKTHQQSFLDPLGQGERRGNIVVVIVLAYLPQNSTLKGLFKCV